MTQPFRNDEIYRSTALDWITVTYQPDHLHFCSTKKLETISSAVWGGGFGYADAIVNWKVPLTYRAADPQSMMRDQLLTWGYTPERTIGLMTAAKLTHAAFSEDEGDAFRLLACTTAGTGNAARAGKVARTYPAYQCGTINTVLMIEGCMSHAAMVNALMTAVEAKAAAMQDAEVYSATGELATGTTSDAIVLAVSQQGFAETHMFAGTATTIGNAIARHVYQTVFEAVRTQKEE
ncbi:UNVERIFIED_CONTAM: adenosylcobinamide hydrolase [Brevibacillus sp. OAP136]